MAHLVQPNVLPIHPERVGRACRDLDLVKAMDGFIETFRKTQDYYHRNQHTETVLDLRQMWNAIFLGDLDRARTLEKRIKFDR